MFSQRFKRGVFILEALNALGTTVYFFYLFFFMTERYHFGNAQNLLLAAGNGLLYSFSALLGGRVGQKYGYLNALIFGFALMCASLTIGCFSHSLPAHLLVAWFCTFGMCFTWPNLEAMVSEGEPPNELPKKVGLYNLVWAGGGAIAYFGGGAMLEKLGLRSMFAVPAVIHFSQIIFAFYLRSQIPPANRAHAALAIIADLETEHAPLPKRKLFLRLAWIANPFAYVTINSVVPLIPSIAKRLQLSPMLAGFFCSTWFFARTGAFFLFWRWNGWHYRFNYLILAYSLVGLGFMTIQLSSSLVLLVVAQIAFGLGLGLIYYSSLYYSMHSSDTKGEHGGIHESIIGLGNCAGPGLGALALYVFPGSHSINVFAVGALLLCGLGWLLLINRRAHPRL